MEELKEEGGMRKERVGREEEDEDEGEEESPQPASQPAT